MVKILLLIGTLLFAGMFLLLMNFAQKFDASQVELSTRRTEALIESFNQCIGLCRFNGGLKFFDMHAEYECVCENGNEANFDWSD